MLEISLQSWAKYRGLMAMDVLGGEGKEDRSRGGRTSRIFLYLVFLSRMPGNLAF